MDESVGALPFGCERVRYTSIAAQGAAVVLRVVDAVESPSTSLIFSARATTHDTPPAGVREEHACCSRGTSHSSSCKPPVNIESLKAIVSESLPGEPLRYPHVLSAAAKKPALVDCLLKRSCASLGLPVGLGVHPSRGNSRTLSTNVGCGPGKAMAAVNATNRVDERIEAFMAKAYRCDLEL